MTLPPFKNWLARPGVVFSAAFLLRSVVMLLLFYQNSLNYGWATNEAAAIARSIVLGHGYGNIFPGAAGPTAWLAPGYPLLLAGIFWVFGMGAASVFVAFLLNVLFASLTSLVILKIGGLQRVPQIGVVGAWLWVISPHGLVVPYLAWDTTLSGLLLAVSVWLSLKAAASGSLRVWVLCGAMWGLVGLTSPALLAPLPVILFYLWWRSRKVVNLIALTGIVLAV